MVDLTSKETLHSLPSSGIVVTNVFLEIILSGFSEKIASKLPTDPIQARIEVKARIISHFWVPITWKQVI